MNDNSVNDNSSISQSTALENDLIMALIMAYNIHAITSGVFYFTDLMTGIVMSMKKAGMMLKFRQLNTPKRFQKFIDLLQESNRVWDLVHFGPNPPPNALVINSADRQPSLLDTVLNNLFNLWGLGHIVTAEALQYYRAVGGTGFKNESSFGKAVKKFVTDNSIEGWDHKRTGFQVGDEKHLVGWVNTRASAENHDVTIMPDRKNRDWGIVHRITSQALVSKLSVDLTFE